MLKNGENSVVISVNDTRHSDDIPSLSPDRWTYGGITRDVLIVEVPQTFIEDYFVQLERGSKRRIAGWVRLACISAPRNVTLRIPELNIGFRSIEVRGTEILLSGSSVSLRGITMHEEAPYRSGRAHRDDDARTLLGWAQDLGCNFLRLAHYPHDEHTTHMGDRLGLLIWPEQPPMHIVQRIVNSHGSPGDDHGPKMRPPGSDPPGSTQWKQL